MKKIINILLLSVFIFGCVPQNIKKEKPKEKQEQIHTLQLIVDGVVAFGLGYIAYKTFIAPDPLPKPTNF